MKRLEEMKKYIVPKWNEQFSEDMDKVKKYFNYHQSEVILEFCQYINNNLISPAKNNSLINDNKGNMNLIISYLHSSLSTRTYVYELSLCNELLYVDKNIKTIFWYPQFLYSYVDDQEKFIKTELQKKFIRVKKYEIETLRQALFSSYWSIAKKYFHDLTIHLSEENLQVYYGEHMGEVTKLS